MSQMCRCELADIGKVAHLQLLIHAVNIPPADAAPFSEDGACWLYDVSEQAPTPSPPRPDEYIRWLATADGAVGPAVLQAALNQVPDFLNRPSPWSR